MKIKQRKDNKNIIDGQDKFTCAERHRDTQGKMNAVFLKI